MVMAVPYDERSLFERVAAESRAMDRAYVSVRAELGLRLATPTHAPGVRAAVSRLLRLARSRMRLLGID